MSRLGLRGRVTLASVATLGAGLLLVSVAINLLLASRLSADASSVLRNRAEAQLATLDTRGGGVRVREARNDQALDQQSWVFTGGRALKRADVPADVDRAATALAGARRSTEREVGDRVRLLAKPAFAQGHRQVATVVVGVPLGPYHRSEDIALAGTIALDLFVLGAGALLVRRSVGAALRPVADMTGKAAAWSERDLHRRFEMGPARDELTGLAATLDGLLARIDTAVRREQRFSAEMAHELRTPLSGLRAEAELVLRGSGSEAELREALERVLAGTDRMAAAIDTLLSAARTGTGPAAGACDPRPPVDRVVASMRQAALARGVAIGVRSDGAPAAVAADEPVVAQALHPLLENAVRHAAAGVQVSIGASDGTVVVSVRDDGPGVPAPDAERIFQPGVSSAGGAGLGLPLARRLARACGGEVTAVPGRGGGRFDLRLPRSGGVQAP